MMKLNRFLAVIAAMMTLINASAQRIDIRRMPSSPDTRIAGVPMDENPVYNPEGVQTDYIMNVTEYTFFGAEQCDGYKMAVRMSDDGRTIWFRDLAPGFNNYGDSEYSWIKGEIDGDDITVKAGQVFYKSADGSQVLYLEVVDMDESGAVKNFLPDIHFTIAGNVIKSADDSCYLSVYEDGETMEDAGFYIFFNGYEMEPVGEIPTFTPPADAEIETYVMSYLGANKFVKVARSGDDVYIAGMSNLAPDDYIPGKVTGDKLTFKSGYILTSGQRYYVCLMGAHPDGMDEWGSEVFEMELEFTFQKDESSDTYVLVPTDNLILETNYYKNKLFGAFRDLKLGKYAGDVAATPAAPSVAEWWEADGIIQFDVPCYDVEGNYLNPAFLAYRLYLDGELYTFTPEDYPSLTQSMTDIPYDFTDNFDIYSAGSLKTIFLHAPQWETIEVESVYTAGGETRISAKGAYSGIEDVEADEAVGVEYTDLTGRRVENPRRGSVVIAVTRYAGGKTTVEKRFVR